MAWHGRSASGNSAYVSGALGVKTMIGTLTTTMPRPVHSVEVRQPNVLHPDEAGTNPAPAVLPLHGNQWLMADADHQQSDQLVGQFDNEARGVSK